MKHFFFPFFSKKSIKKLSLRYLFLLLFFIVINGYMVFHVFHGDRNIFILNKLKAEMFYLDYKYQQKEQYQQELEEKVQWLKPETLDKDFLEERVRIILNYVHPDDKVIIGV